MCQISSEITFCTCSHFDQDEIVQLKNHWILYRFNEELEVYIVGEVFIDHSKTENPTNLVEVVLEKLHNNSLFDQPIVFQNANRLKVVIECNDVCLVFGLEFQDNSWSEIEYDYFSWANCYEAKKGGEVKLI